LLVPQPPLSLLYLLAVRDGRVAPSFVPLLLLALLPVASAMVGVLTRGPSRPGDRRWRAALIAVAVLELAWTAVSEAMVGFAIAWRSG
jgi:hypothetical protein